MMAKLAQVLTVIWATSLVVSYASAIGVNYGQVASDLPAPATVLNLVKTTTINKIKLYGADPDVLTAFANSGIDFVIGAGNDQITPLGSDPNVAVQWVNANIVAYPQTSITAVCLGNEVLTLAPDLNALLLPALKNLHTALKLVGLADKVKVSTPHSLSTLATSFPPSLGTFHNKHAEVITPLLEFLSETGSPFMINAYPYFAYTANPKNVSLDYVLFQPTAVPVEDETSKLQYTNMFDAQVDAIYAALSRAGHNNITVMVTETGWPSMGEPTEEGPSITNAQLYNSGLIKHIESGTGTPAKANVPIETYIFALYNENLKPGPLSEKNFGLFMSSGAEVYKSGLTAVPNTFYPPPPPTIPVLPPPYLSSPPPPVLPITPPVVPASPPPVIPISPPVVPASPPPVIPIAPPVVPASPPPVIPIVPPVVPASPPPVIPIAPPVTPAVPPPVPGTPVPYTPPVITGSSWCVAKEGADPHQLQIALDFACSEGGANCGPLQEGQPCFEPNTIVNHASYAFNSYYQINNRNYWNCYFNDTGVITTVNPSYGVCVYNVGL